MNPISILSVVPNNEEAEANIARAKNKLEDFVNQASASETKVNILATIDQNVAQGIARISKEVIADLIILGWPTEKGLINKIIGKKMQRIIHTAQKTAFVTHFGRPVALHKRIFVAVPPLAEKEPGFAKWLKKILLLSKELSLPVFCYCNDETAESIKAEEKKMKTDTPLNFNHFSSWDDFLILGRDIQAEDIIVLVSARSGSVSYNNTLPTLPVKLEKYFTDKSRIVVYP